MTDSTRHCGPPTGSAFDWVRELADVEFAEVSPNRPAGAPVDVAATVAALERAGLLVAVTAAVAGARPLTLVVNDNHRPTDTRTFVDALVQILRNEGIAPQDLPMRLLVAAGTHRSTPRERADHEDSILGPHRDRFTSLEWNDATAETNRIFVEGYGFHRLAADGGLVVACGSTEPHYFAGITGAHKTLTVGIFDSATIERNHAHAMDAASGGLVLEGNPVHDGIARAVRALEGYGSELFVLNQVMVDGSAVEIFAGRPLQALAEAAPIVRACFGHRIEQTVDICIAEVAAPLDRDLYQADKGIKNTEVAVRDGGVLVLRAACDAGVGIDHFVELLRIAPSHAAALAEVERRGYRLGDHKAVRLRALTDTRNVSLVVVSPHLDRSMESLIGAKIVADESAACSWLRQRLGIGSRGLIIRDAGNVTMEVA